MKNIFSFLALSSLLLVGACTSSTDTTTEVTEETSETSEALDADALKRIFSECDSEPECVFDAFAAYDFQNYWSGVSYAVAEYRQTGAYENAYSITRLIVKKDPDQKALMLIWDGDTALWEEDFEKAVGFYREVVEEHGNEMFDDTTPLGLLALKYEASAYLQDDKYLEAAQSNRDILEFYSDSLGDDREELENIIANILVYETYAELDPGFEFDRGPANYLLNEDVCSEEKLCLMDGASISFLTSAPSEYDFDYHFIYFQLSEDDKELLHYLN